ncbi:hypothetical protein [Pedobacter nyackensis]|uniref:Uncharacterized protein n=1 Tax=Pedobacter nyackensis TaxID=475255 RepID=A0A1W1ZWJ0_9SPHI|nr:hypothetical protein [Pedobacter nyackensis]SMC52774.1 hypothetical protein SAMN04488101_101109 [Pedobacter nyackensis]
MSNVTGAIKFKDGTIRFYEYYGTSDVCSTKHYSTQKEVADNWRSYPSNRCSCEGLEPVSIYSSYGGGFYLDGFACKNCEALAHDPDFDMIEREDTEDWILQIWPWEELV